MTAIAVKNPLCAQSNHFTDYFSATMMFATQPVFKAFCKELSAAAGKKRKAFFLPLCATLTADNHGPERDKFWHLLDEERTRHRFTAAGRCAKHN